MYKRQLYHLSLKETDSQTLSAFIYIIAMDVPKRKTISMIFLHPKFQRNSSKKSRQTSDNLVKGPLKSTSAYRAFEQHQTGSNSILSWLTRSLDEPSVQIRIWLFLSSSSNSANEPCILLRQGVEHTAHHFRFRISRSSTILCRLSGQ